MTAYVSVFLLMVMGVLFDIRFEKKSKNIIYFLVFVFFVLFLGLRHEVGGDWFAYLNAYKRFRVDNV